MTSRATPRVGPFGSFGGRFVPELLIPALEQLEEAWRDVLPSPAFQDALGQELRDWAGRPTPLTHVPTVSSRARCRVLLKREDLLHGGAHKTNNASSA